jgi:hypothetical protein
MSKIHLTSEQLDVARHALGLDIRHRKSYRNRYVGEDPAFREMVAIGAAQVKECKNNQPTGGHPYFWLTLEGATASLRPHESLDMKDFV